jgi:hypothetical protein
VTKKQLYSDRHVKALTFVELVVAFGLGPISLYPAVSATRLLMGGLEGNVIRAGVLSVLSLTLFTFFINTVSALFKSIVLWREFEAKVHASRESGRVLIIVPSETGFYTGMASEEVSAKF